MMLFKVLLLVSVVLLLVVPQVRSESDIDKDFQAMLDRLDDPVPDPLTPEEELSGTIKKTLLQKSWRESKLNSKLTSTRLSHTSAKRIWPK